MRVKLLVGSRGLGSVGDELEVPEDEAVRLICSRWAIPVQAPIERAVKAPVETRKRKK